MKTKPELWELLMGWLDLFVVSLIFVFMLYVIAEYVV